MKPHLDGQECEGYFFPDILQKKYRGDIEILRDYTATGKYKSENIQGNQFMERCRERYVANWYSLSKFLECR